MNKILLFKYNLLVNFANLLLPIAAIFSQKIKYYLTGQIEINGHLKTIQTFRNRNPDLKIVWFHCASLGEFEQGKPVIEKYKNTYPSHKILLTFFSSSGYNVKKNYESADFVMYLPIDTHAKCQKFIQIVNPCLAVFVKYEFWPNIISMLAKYKIPTIGISVILRQNQLFFKSYGGFFRDILYKFEALFIQNNQTACLLESINYKNYLVTGDTRFDSVVLNSKTVNSIPEIEKFIGSGKNVMVCGSVWQTDMNVLIPLINQNKNYKFIIAPHDIHPEEIRIWREVIHSKTALFSDGQIDEDTSVVFIDSVGILKTLYKYAKVSYIGGGLGKGLHNTLEAAVYKSPVIFGDKSYHKYQEAIDLLNIEVGFAISSTEEIQEVLNRLESDNSILLKINKSTEHYINSNLGATEKIMNYIAKTLN